MWPGRSSRRRAAFRSPLAVMVAGATLGLAMTGGAVVPAARLAAAVTFNASNTSIPLLLIHGFNDDCGTAWNTIGYLSDNKTPRPGANSAARSRERFAIATAVSTLEACAGSKPRNAVRARTSYGTTASSSKRDPPGTRSSSAIAPLPPPVMASAAWRPDVYIAAIICRHDASPTSRSRELMVGWRP